jgi:hypothetical protein
MWGCRDKMQCVSVAERILYLLQSVMFVKPVEGGYIFVYSWMQLWEIEIKCLTYLDLLCCVIIMWCMCQMVMEEMTVMITFISGCCWLHAAFFFFECCTAVINTPAYSRVTPFLSSPFSLSLSFLNWLVWISRTKFQPSFSHCIPHILPHATVLFVFAFSYETDVKGI